jgi:AcrR family transcriptional regulator
VSVTRQSILAAAAVEFAEGGYTGATLAKVGQRLGLTKSAVLYHFATKEQLFEEMLEPLTLATAALVDSYDALPTLDDQIDFIAALMRLQLGFHPEIQVLHNDRSAWRRGKVGDRMALTYTRLVSLLAGPDPSAETLMRARAALSIFFRAITSGVDMRGPIESVESDAGQQVLAICADILRPSSTAGASSSGA